MLRLRGFTDRICVFNHSKALIALNTTWNESHMVWKHGKSGANGSLTGAKGGTRESGSKGSSRGRLRGAGSAHRAELACPDESYKD
jgi:hypothetical protein